ncbi:MAG: hypothetical protein WB780_21965 [Candidatus Acidiferrales bacterium]
MSGAQKDHAKIYFNVREHVFLLVALGKWGRFGLKEIGTPTRIPDGEFEYQIGRLLVEHLDSFEGNVSSRENTRRFSDSEYRVFRKQHIGVSVERPPSGEIILHPLHHLQGGYVANRGEQVVVRKEDIPDKVPEALREAFRLAT